MSKFIIIIILSFTGCSIKPSFPLDPLFKKSYSELLNEYKSCSGKGVIDSKGEINGKMYFSFKSQRDSTFFQFSDILGRKLLLMWVSPYNITVRDLINNKYYNSSQVIDLFPFLKILNNRNITEIVWGVEPDYKPSLKKINRQLNSNIELNFDRSHYINEKHALSTLNYSDINFRFTLDFKNRQRESDYVNIKKLWKMLEY